MMNFTTQDVFRSIERVADILPIMDPAVSMCFGDHASPRVSEEGDDFFRLTPYEVSEHNPFKIDWLARDPFTRELFVRENILRKNLTVITLLDVSRSMMFAVEGDAQKIKMALVSYGSIGLACVRSQDPYGLVGFAGNFVTRFNSEEFSSSRDDLYQNIYTLYEFFTEAYKDKSGGVSGGIEGYYNAFDYLRSHYSDRQCLVIVISDFVDFEEFNMEVLRQYRELFDMAFVFLDDPSEFKVNSWSGDYIRNTSLETGEVSVVRVGELPEIEKDIRQSRDYLRHVTLKDLLVPSIVLEPSKDYERLHRFFLERMEGFRT